MHGTSRTTSTPTFTAAHVHVTSSSASSSSSSSAPGACQFVPHDRRVRVKGAPYHGTTPLVAAYPISAPDISPPPVPQQRVAAYPPLVPRRRSVPDNA
eukprot:3417888-Rhodomonas_salina.4